MPSTSTPCGRRAPPPCLSRHPMQRLRPRAAPYCSMAAVMAKLFPSAVKPGSVFDETGISPAALVHPTARLEAGVVVDPGAVIGRGAEIGAGSIIGANAVIGPE